MTLQEIQAQIDAARATLAPEGESHNCWDLFPRVNYVDLPAQLKKAVDQFYTVDRAKQFLMKLYPVGTFDGMDKQTFEQKIKQALQASVYVVESTDLESYKRSLLPEEIAFPIVLLGANLAKAWNEISSLPLPLSIAASARLQKLDFPIDKVNSNVWKQLEKDMHGQLAIDTGTASVIYSISFDELGPDVHITRQLEPYDKRVYIAVASLFNAGNSVMTSTQIYRAMGHEGKPAQTDIKRIDDSITKLSAARVTINNEAEAAATNYERFVYDAALLPMERVQAIISGKKADTAIHLFREPPLVSFARGRKQITTIDRKLLNTPLSKTNKTILIEDYLLERISRAKHDKKQAEKILFETIYKSASITGKERQRAPGKLQKILQHYLENEFIQSYELIPNESKPDAIIVHL